MKRPPLTIDPGDPRPIWRQIEDGVRLSVATGVLAPGAAVLSVRELARALQVNPNTVARAYLRLGEAGVLEVRRGEGTFVAADPPVVGDEERRRGLAEEAGRFAAAAARLHATPEEALEAVRKALAGQAGPRKEEER
ncbi:MAG: GntR family transcriptional regulator [Thermoanaerobaculia bacterium]|nr:GntR family transcriptional regulator [Thermoanaerobaculia bacterium]